MKCPSDAPAPAASRGHEPTEVLRLTPSYGDPPDDADDWDEDDQEDDDQDDEGDEDDEEDEEPEWYVSAEAGA